ncbi:hypothetical protein C5167_003832 [Papaver somniferum]|uniref:Uncharacterized protein n=1 Tax=Papaver somniferum TaxID=3469 RepID=A0A4Y7L000_PAPSO|nr:hypothetical protein C5167_003832 [Papaver somniferum]
MENTIVEENHHRKGEETQGGEEVKGTSCGSRDTKFPEKKQKLCDFELQSKSGKELKKLLGNSAGMNDSDAGSSYCYKLREATTVVEIMNDFGGSKPLVVEGIRYSIDEIKPGFMKDQKDIEETMGELSPAFIRFTDNVKMVCSLFLVIGCRVQDVTINPSKGLSLLTGGISSDEQKKLGHLEVKYV